MNIFNIQFTMVYTVSNVACIKHHNAHITIENKVKKGKYHTSNSC